MADEDDDFRKHILGMVQILVFGVTLCLLAIVYYGQPTGEICGQDKVRTESGSGDIVRAHEDPAS
jgi:hypothetical protein